MINFIREAGVPIYLVLAFGLAALGAAIHYRRHLKREHLEIVKGLSIATIVTGVLGTVLGVQKSAEAIGGVETSMKWIFLYGLRESLNNLVAALALVCVVVLIVTSGAIDAARKATSA